MISCGEKPSILTPILAVGLPQRGLSRAKDRGNNEIHFRQFALSDKIVAQVSLINIYVTNFEFCWKRPCAAALAIAFSVTQRHSRFDGSTLSQLFRRRPLVSVLTGEYVIADLTGSSVGVRLTSVCGAVWLTPKMML
jgi:predicted Abi (CAAX) family protease